VNVRELIALAKSKPDQLDLRLDRQRRINHLAGELFKLMTNTKMITCHTRAAGRCRSRFVGRSQHIVAEPATIVQHLEAGECARSQVTTPKHSLALPDLPTVAESGVPGYDVTSWNGMLIRPARRPTSSSANAEFNKAITAPDMRKRMIENGYEPVGGEPEKLSELIRVETAKWAKVVKAAGMKVD
jgi:tripartite-type tricarboxylate transporter receptor subunit TctC